MARRKNRKATREEIRQARFVLALIYPKTFTPPKEEKRPLKIGIDVDLLKDVRAKAPGVSRRIILACLNEYTTGIRYLRNMTAGAERIDLAGDVCGHVTEEQATIAADSMTHRQKWIDQRRSKK